MYEGHNQSSTVTPLAQSLVRRLSASLTLSHLIHLIWDNSWNITEYCSLIWWYIRCLLWNARVWIRDYSWDCVYANWTAGISSASSQVSKYFVIYCEILSRGLPLSDWKDELDVLNGFICVTGKASYVLLPTNSI